MSLAVGALSIPNFYGLFKYCTASCTSRYVEMGLDLRRPRMDLYKNMPNRKTFGAKSQNASIIKLTEQQYITITSS